MRHLYLAVVSFLLATTSIAQPTPNLDARFGGTPQWGGATPKSAEACGPVVNNYLGFEKSPTVHWIHQDTNNWYIGGAQYYDAPQDITVHGVSFFAFVAPNSADSIKVYTELYSAGADSLPQTLLAIDSVWVTGHTATLQLPNVQYTGTFDTPVTVTGPYCVGVRSTPVDTLWLYSNDPFGGGQGEHLGSIYYGVPSQPQWHAWYRSWTGGLDMDYLILPVVSYEAFGPVTLATGTDPYCMGDQVCLSYAQSAIHGNRMYSNDHANPAQSIHWAWGDGTYVEDLSSVCHGYTVAGAYDIILTDTLDHLGLNSGECVMRDTVSIEVWDDAVADFSWTNAGYTVDFTNLSMYDTSAMWYFGDGDSSSLMDPSHTFDSATSYSVMLVVSGFCGDDTVTIDVDLTSLSIDDHDLSSLELYPNPVQSELRIKGVPSNARFVLRNVLGAEIMRGEVGEGRLDLTTLPKGMYLIEVGLEGEKLTKRLIKR